MITEADTGRKYILPKLTATGWDTASHSFTEHKTFIVGCILLIGDTAHRGFQKCTYCLWRNTRDFTIAGAEADAAYKSPDGLQVKGNAVKQSQTLTQARFVSTCCYRACWIRGQGEW